MTSEIDVTVRGALTEIVLARPHAGNALSVTLVESILSALDNLREECRVVVFRGEGKGFCGGFDLSDLETESDASLLWRLVRIEILLQRVAALPIQTVAIAHRFAYGAGADLYAACNSRYAAPGTRFAFPGVRFGIALGTGRLARIVGPEIAREFLDANDPIDLDTALRTGFVRGIWEPQEFSDRTEELVAWEGALDTRMSRVVSERIGYADHAEDMAALVCSAAEPGLKERIRNYTLRARSARSAAS